MKTRYFLLPKETIQAFAERNDLIMEVRQRHYEDGPTKFYAHFADSDVKEGCFLRGVYGDGPTPESAIANYARVISSSTLVIRAMWPDRHEISVPELQ